MKSEYEELKDNNAVQAITTVCLLTDADGDGAADEWRSLAIEVKTITGYFDKEEKQQLKAAGTYAKNKGKKLLYFFLEKPKRPVENAIKNEDRSVIYFYERKQ